MATIGGLKGLSKSHLCQTFSTESLKSWNVGARLWDWPPGGEVVSFPINQPLQHKGTNIITAPALWTRLVGDTQHSLAKTLTDPLNRANKVLTSSTPAIAKQ